VASKAIYSEIVELVLNIDKYKTNIDEAAKTLSTLKAKIEESKTWEIKVATGSYIKSIDDSIRLERALAEEIRRTNRVYNERKNILDGLITPAESRSMAAQLRAKGKGGYIAASGVNVPASQSAADSVSMELQAQDALAEAHKRYADAKTDRERKAAKATVDRLNRERDMEAGNAIAAEKVQQQIADQQVRNRKLVEESGDREARHQQRLMAHEKTRAKDIDNFFAKQAEGINRLSNYERSEAVRRRAEYHEMLALDNQRLQIIKQREAAERAAETAALRASKRAALEEHQSLKGTYGYKVGRMATGARVGAGLDIAAGAAFGLGATNLGGMLYMMERFSYASGIGQKNLGELLQKLGLVKLTGEGAATSMQLLGNNIMKLGGAVAAVAAPIGAMFAGNKLDNAIANMSTLLASTTVTGDKFNAMMDDTAAAAARVSESFGLGLVDTVNGFKTALSTGIEAENLESFGNLAATVTKGLGTTFDDAVGILTTFKDSYNLNMEGMRESSDVLFNAINVGKFQVDDLKNNIGRVVTSAAEAGVGIKDMSAGLATLTRVGLSTSQSITSMNRFINNIVSPTDKARAMFDKLGLATGHAAFKTQTLMQYLYKLKAAVGDNADLMSELFTTEQGRRGAIGLTTNMGLTSEVRTAMDDVGTATIAANRAMDTFSQNFGKVFTAIWDVVQLVGRDLLQVANDVFFPGGPMGTDTLTGIKNVMETIGIAVKAVGVVIITVAGTIYNTVKFAVDSVGFLIGLVKGEFLEAGEKLGTSFTNIFVGLGDGLLGFTTIGDSISRIGNKAVETTEKISNGLVIAADTAVKFTAAFGDDATKELEGYAAKTLTVFDKIIAKIDAAREAQARLEFERKNPKEESVSDVNVPRTDAEKKFTKDYAKGMLLRKRIEEYLDAGINFDGRFTNNQIKGKDTAGRNATISNIITGRGLQDPNDPATFKAYEQILKGIADRSEQAAAERAVTDAKAYEESWRKYAASKGIKLAPTVEGAGSTPYPDDMLRGMRGLMGILKDITDGTKVTGTRKTTGYIFGSDAEGISSSGTATTTSSVVLTPEEQLQKARELLDVLKGYYERHKNTMAESDRKATEAQLKFAQDSIEKLDKKQKEATAEKYKVEYENAKKLYDIKMSYFDKEGKRIDALLEKYSDFFKTLDQRRADREFSRMDPMRAYRQQREGIETGIENLRNVKDPTDALKASEALLKRIDAFMSQGEKVGEGRRASMFADDFELAIAAIMKTKEGGLKKEKTANDNNIDNAIAKFKSDMASNPVAQAALAQAMVVVKEAVGKAAENGIGVSGDLVQSIDISDINVDIPVDKFKSMVRDLAKTVFADMYRDTGKGNAVKGLDNVSPVGAP